MNTKLIMTKAWTDARAAAKRFGGRASEFFAASLRNTWKMAKLLAAGGKLWEAGDKVRIYFNDLEARLAKAVGIEFGSYKTGSISWARKNGEKISNSECYRQLSKVSYNSKLWFDLVTGQWGWKDMTADTASTIINAM